MYHHHTAPGGAYAKRMHHPFAQSFHRAPVNAYKTDNSYELMVFAPGRIKEHFSVTTKGTELTITYNHLQVSKARNGYKENTVAAVLKELLHWMKPSM